MTRKDLVALLALALLALAGPLLALRYTGPVVLNLGPNDTDAIEGFREDWERDGLTRFRWAMLSSALRFPVRLGGEGHVLRMRVRRHFLDPAEVRVRVEGRPAGTFTIAADPHVPYRIVEIPLGRLEGRLPFRLSFEARVENPRPLGVAMDWVQVERAPGTAATVALAPLPRFAILLVVLVSFLVPRLAGAGPGQAAAHAAFVAVAVLGLIARNVMAADRILREGAGAYAFVALVAWAAVAWWQRRTLAERGEAAWIAGTLVILVLLAALLRLGLLLHPEFYYNDVKVHALFAWQLERRGIVAFLRDFTANQYRWSLGLQFENGHWYAFPYPPLFYLLTWPLVRLGYRPEVSVSLLAVAANSLEVLLVFAIARSFLLARQVALAAAAALVVLPIFLARLTLAYFPALVGHSVDALLILYLIRCWPRMGERRTVAVLSGLLALALLTYTQSVLNFGLLLPLFLMVEVVADATAEGRRRQLGLFAAGAIGVLLSIGCFYGRYIPIFVGMRQGVPMAEEKILLEKQEADRRLQAEPVQDEEPDDPYSGPSFDVVRGLKKAVSRIYIFYSGFALAVVAGLIVLLGRLEGTQRRWGAVWAISYVLLNLASGALPGPNLVRYNKDLEIVAPLFCTALALVAERLWRVARPLAITYGAAFVIFGGGRAMRYFAERLVLEK